MIELVVSAAILSLLLCAILAVLCGGALLLALHIGLSYFGVYPQAKVALDTSKIGEQVAAQFMQRVPMRAGPAPSAGQSQP